TKWSVSVESVKYMGEVFVVLKSLYSQKPGTLNSAMKDNHIECLCVMIHFCKVLRGSEVIVSEYSGILNFLIATVKYMKQWLELYSSTDDGPSLCDPDFNVSREPHLISQAELNDLE
ncbi:hypothetical protein L9F63_026048, partial [Diploptera punctata]